MKRFLALTLALVLALTLVTPALADEAVTPAPPEWISPEEYIIIPGDEVYQPENWAKIEALREEARNGFKPTEEQMDVTKHNTRDMSTGTLYETALVWMKYGENLGFDDPEFRRAFFVAGRRISSAVNDL